jgi:outer membrane receptor protein involved in Fe transport
LDHDLAIMGAAPNSYYPGYPGYYITGSTNLKPEANMTQEVGYRSLLLDQKLKVDATLFSTEVKDVIDFVDTSFSPPSTFNNGSLSTKGAELALDYQYNNDLSFSTDYSYLYPHMKPETSNTPSTVGYDTMASNNIVGIGTRYTLNKFKFDLYGKYFEGYTAGNTKIRGYYKTFMRISYDFVTPRCLGKLDSTVYLDVDDALGARQIEDSGNKIYMKPEVMAGIKVRF